LICIQKLTRRNLALERVDWDERKKAEASRILRSDAMSSEESTYEDDEQGHFKVVGYKIKGLSWEIPKLKKMKRKLDKIYKKTLTQRAKDRILPRVDGIRPSGRLLPDNMPEWAVV
jgi:hypothetical protein